MKQKNIAILLIYLLFLINALAMEKDPFEDDTTYQTVGGCILSGCISSSAYLFYDATYGQALAAGATASNICAYTLSMLEDSGQYLGERFIGELAFGLCTSGLCYLCDAPPEWSIVTGVTMANFLRWYGKKNSSLLKKNVERHYAQEAKNEKILEEQQHADELLEQKRLKKFAKDERRRKAKELKERQRDENREKSRPTLTQIKYKREQLFKNLKNYLAEHEKNSQEAAQRRQNKKQIFYTQDAQEENVVVQTVDYDIEIIKDDEPKKEPKKKTKGEPNLTKARNFHQPSQSLEHDVHNHDDDDQFLTIMLKPNTKKLIANLFEVGSKNSVENLLHIYEALGFSIKYGERGTSHRKVSMKNMKPIIVSGKIDDKAFPYQEKAAKKILNIFGITKNDVDNWQH